eukprot:CAMPEP_0170651408 /NCGR_PEP_ID=MMETSP0224-20130122/46355_1 /TAXON_ID=285029 /ORGANISM="Togula jolla, Strain CCCM 725" /LENGTH=192 /DNA_ID=CAMNT_0010983205 /DNA_START=1371 /DNA_END=1945 /DNA_ORIENTATION=-
MGRELKRSSQHTIRNLLEYSAENRSRDAQHARVDVLHQKLLDPLEDKLSPAFAFLQVEPALIVDPAEVDELIAAVHEVPAIIVTVLNGHQGARVEQAHQSNKGMLERFNLFLGAPGVLAEGAEGVGGIGPFCAHPVSGRAAIPEAGVSLAGSKDDQETNEEAEATPDRVVRENAWRVFSQEGWLAEVSDGEL